MITYKPNRGRSFNPAGPLSRGLVACFIFNCYSAPFEWDYSPYRQPGSFNGIGWSVDTGGFVPYFDSGSVNDTILSGILEIYNVTIAAKIKPNGAAADGYIVANGTSTFTTGFGLHWQGSTNKLLYFGLGSAIPSSAVFTENNVWVAPQVTADINGNVKFYKNALYVSGAVGSSASPRTDPVNIGNRNGPSRSAGTAFDGLIEYLFIWDRILTQVELYNHYNNPYQTIFGRAFSISSIASGGSVLPMMHYYRQMRV